jgi:hypothetical protein
MKTVQPFSNWAVQADITDDDVIRGDDVIAEEHGY